MTILILEWPNMAASVTRSMPDSAARVAQLPHISILRCGVFELKPSIFIFSMHSSSSNPRSQKRDLGHPTFVVCWDVGHPPWRATMKADCISFDHSILRDFRRQVFVARVIRSTRCARQRPERRRSAAKRLFLCPCIAHFVLLPGPLRPRHCSAAWWSRFARLPRSSPTRSLIAGSWAARAAGIICWPSPRHTGFI